MSGRKTGIARMALPPFNRAPHTTRPPPVSCLAARRAAEHYKSRRSAAHLIAQLRHGLPTRQSRSNWGSPEPGRNVTWRMGSFGNDPQTCPNKRWRGRRYISEKQTCQPSPGLFLSGTLQLPPA